MLVVLQTHGFPTEITTGDNLQKRYNRYYKRYKDTLAMLLQSGGGLSKTEVLLGMTIEDKVNKACPHFDRMHALYGERANVAPPALGEFGLGDDLISTQVVNQDPEEDEPIARLATPTKILPENAGGDNPMEDIEAPFWDQYPTVTDLANKVYEGDVTEATENSPDPPSPSCAPNSSPNPAVRTQATRLSAPAAARTSPPPPSSTLVAAGRPNASATPAPAGQGKPNGPGAPPRIGIRLLRSHPQSRLWHLCIQTSSAKKLSTSVTW